MWGYKKRLTRDVERWTANGWLAPGGGAKILDELSRSRPTVGLASALGVLASVLLGFAVMSFVAAHWQEMSRASRLGMLAALIMAGYATAGWLWSRRAEKLADAAILFGCAAFGASIMLVSQMFHIEGRPPDGVLLWMLGTAIAGVVLRSNATLAFALVLAAAWSVMETGERTTPHWPFLIPWALLAAAFTWQRWRPGLHLSALTLSVFVVALGYQLSDGHAHGLVAAIGAAVALAAVGLSRLDLNYQSVTEPVFSYGLGAAYAGLFALQFIESADTTTVIVLGAISLVALLAAISYGLMTHNPGAIWLGYIGFSIEILALYWKTIGSILGTSVFFLIAGLLVAALAAFAWRIASRSEGAPA